MGVKGWYLLEARLGVRARATKDIDLAMVDASSDLADALATALLRDPDGDGFVLQISASHTHSADAAKLGGPGARLSVTASLAGRVFSKIRVDVVSRPEEIIGGTERIELPVMFAEPGWGPVQVTVVDVAQHLAEKLHAISEVYAHARQSTRVKDLIDVVLMHDAATIDESRLGERLLTVFTARNGTVPPIELPEPPEAWTSEYAKMAHDLDASAQTLPEAMRIATHLYARALNKTRGKIRDFEL